MYERIRPVEGRFIEVSLLDRRQPCKSFSSLLSEVVGLDFH